MPFPVLNPLWWTDGVHVLPMHDHTTVNAWRERGVSRGWVVAAGSEEKALAIGKKLLDKLSNWS